MRRPPLPRVNPPQISGTRFPSLNSAKTSCWCFSTFSQIAIWSPSFNSLVKLLLIHQLLVTSCCQYLVQFTMPFKRVKLPLLQYWIKKLPKISLIPSRVMKIGQKHMLRLLVSLPDRLFHKLLILSFQFTKPILMKRNDSTALRLNDKYSIPILLIVLMAKN